VKRLIFICLSIGFFSSCDQEAATSSEVFDASLYITYVKGNIPLIISVPHGGELKPNTIPDRTCNDAVNISDAYTVELALEIMQVFEKNGQRPYLVINKMHRSKMDANRNKSEATCENANAIEVWEEYHKNIEASLTAVNSKFNKGLFIDLHGHGNPKQRIELGYLLYEDELALPDESLNSSEILTVSSIQSLARQNKSGVSHADLLKGKFSLGSLFHNSGFPTVPSSADPFPLASDPYFSGGYNTANYSSYSGGNIDGIQIECNRIGIRDLESSLIAFSKVFTTVLSDYLLEHYFDPIPVSD
jgi:hypothetical protein